MKKNWFKWLLEIVAIACIWFVLFQIVAIRRQGDTWDARIASMKDTIARDYYRQARIDTNLPASVDGMDVSVAFHTLKVVSVPVSTNAFERFIARDAKGPIDEGTEFQFIPLGQVGKLYNE